MTYGKLDEDVFEAGLVEALDQLQAMKDRGIDDPARPEEMPRKTIELVPNVFQVRGLTLNEAHVSDLLALLKQGRRLDPVTLWRCGQHALLVDGHHRLAAYEAFARDQEKAVPVPCRWIEGSAVEAMDEAAATNVKVKLPMTHDQRANFAWSLVRADRFSKAKIVEVSGVSDGTVGTMRRTLRKLVEAGISTVKSTWVVALARLKHGQTQMSDEDWAARDALEVQRHVKGLQKVIGDRWYRKPELAAAALDTFLGRRTPEVVRSWVAKSDHMTIDDFDKWVEAERNPEF